MLAQAGSYIINGIVAVIVILGLIALRALARAFTALQREDNEINALQKIVQQPESLSRIQDNISESATKNTVANRVFRDAVFTGRFNVETCNLSDYIHTSRYLAGIFVFVGLLGTVSGIAISTTGLNDSSKQLSDSSGTISSEATDKFQKDIGVLLGGMGGAFSCTFAGLLATLLISAGNSHFINQSRRREQTIEELARHQLVPLYEADCNQRTRTEEVRQTLFAWLEKLHEETVQNRDIARTGHQELLTSVQSLNRSVVAAIHDNNGMVQAERLSDSAQHVATVVAKLDGTVEAAVTRWQQIVDSTRDLVQTIQTTGNDLGKQMTQSAGELTRLNAIADTRVETFQGYVTNTLAQLQRTGERLESAVVSLQNSVQNLPQERAGLQNAAEQVTRAADEMAASIRNLRSEIVDSNHNQEVALTNLGKEISHTAVQLEDLLRRFEITLADIAGIVTIRPIHDELEQIRRDLFAELAHVEDLTREADAKKLQPRLTEMQNQLQEQIGRVERGLQTRNAGQSSRARSEESGSERPASRGASSRGSATVRDGSETQPPSQPRLQAPPRTSSATAKLPEVTNTIMPERIAEESDEVSKAPEKQPVWRSVWQSISQLWTNDR